MKIALMSGSREAQTLRDRLAKAGHVVEVLEETSIPARLSADAVIDASHPSEAATHREIARLCAQGSSLPGLTRQSGLPLLRYRRRPWSAGPADRWIEVADAATARQTLKTEWTRVFLCMGHSDRGAFAGDSDRWYLARARSAERQRETLHEFELTSKAGPYSPESEAELMRAHRIDVLITRNAGGKGAFPKIAAARMLGLPVILMRQPPVTCPEAHEESEVIAWLEGLPPR